MSQTTNAAATPPRVLVITPARDEARFLPDMIRAMVAQTLRPVAWILVDDGSSDATGTIATAAAAEHDWIHVVRREREGSRALGGGVIRAFQAGLDSHTGPDWDYVAKVDADLTFGPDYLRAAVEHLEQDPGLAAVSGKVYRNEAGRDVEEFLIDEMVAGCWKLYRRAAFADIGGFHPAIMWDGIDIHRARMAGWRTASIRDGRMRILHHRLMGSSDKNVLRGRMRWGLGQWYLGSHPLYTLAASLFRMREKPFVIGGLLIFWGYVKAALRGVPRYEHPGFRRALRSWQFARLGRVLRLGGVR